MKFINCFSNPYPLSLAITKFWSMQSNGLEKPVNTAPVSLPSSRVFQTLLRDNAVHWNLSETNTKIWRILFENMDRFKYILASHKVYLDWQNAYWAIIFFASYE